MKIKRIYFLRAASSQYGVLEYFLEQLMQSFLKRGVECLQFNFQEQKEQKKLMKALQAYPPDCMISFQYLPAELDLLQIPLLCYLVDSAIHYFPFFPPNTHTILSNVDSDSCQAFRSMGAPHVLHLLHAVDSHLPIYQGKRKYPLTLLGGIGDLEETRKQWQIKYPTRLIQLMDQMVERALTEKESSFFDIFDEGWSTRGDEAKSISYESVFKDCEFYYRTKSRLALVQSIHSLPVHIFSHQSYVWEKYCGSQENVTVHSGVEHSQALEIMQQTQVMLNSSVQFKRGSHERIFYGLMYGTSILSEETPFIEKEFGEGRGVVSFSYREKEAIDPTVRTLLEDEERRLNQALKGRKKVLESHTWEARVEQIMVQIPPILESMQNDRKSKKEWFL